MPKRWLKIKITGRKIPYFFWNYISCNSKEHLKLLFYLDNKKARKKVKYKKTPCVFLFFLKSAPLCLPLNLLPEPDSTAST